MNDYISSQLQLLETFISETGKKTGRVSGAMAKQALEILRREVERTDINLSAILSEQAIEVKEQTVPEIEISALRQYVTVVEMTAKHVVLPSLDGVGHVRLDARLPETGSVDELILFGDQHRPGVTNAWATIFISQFQDRLCAYDLGVMICSVTPVAHAKWVASTYLLDDLAEMVDESGKRIFEENVPASMFGFPVIWIDGEMCREHNFKIALADLRYYVWGEYRNDDSLLVDGAIGAGPLANSGGSTIRSPFVVLKRDGER